MMKNSTFNSGGAASAAPPKQQQNEKKTSINLLHLLHYDNSHILLVVLCIPISFVE